MARPRTAFSIDPCKCFIALCTILGSMSVSHKRACAAVQRHVSRIKSSCQIALASAPCRRPNWKNRPKIRSKIRQNPIFDVFGPFWASWRSGTRLKSFLGPMRFNPTLYEPVATLKTSNHLSFFIFQPRLLLRFSKKNTIVRCRGRCDTNLACGLSSLDCPGRESPSGLVSF